MADLPNDLHDNPLLVANGLPRFDRIKPEHIVPAVQHVLAQAEQRLAEIEQSLSDLGQSLLGLCQHMLHGRNDVLRLDSVKSRQSVGDKQWVVVKFVGQVRHESFLSEEIGQ